MKSTVIIGMLGFTILVGAVDLFSAQVFALAFPVVSASADPTRFDFGNLTATALLGWYAWHTASKTQPQLIADFRAELKDTRDHYLTSKRMILEDAALARTHFSEQMDRFWLEHREERDQFLRCLDEKFPRKPDPA